MLSQFRFNFRVQSQHTYQTAIGWFDLGNYVEAFNELENLPTEHRASVEAMELRCRIYRKLKKWRELELLAEGCYASSKQNVVFVSPWAWALLKLGRADEARGALERHHAKHTTRDAEFCFTFACVLASLGEKGPAKWLQTAFILSNIMVMALQQKNQLRMVAAPRADEEPATLSPGDFEQSTVPVILPWHPML